MELSHCDICDNCDFDEIATLDRHNQPLSTVICRSCGLVRHAKVPTELELQQFYSDGYREAYNGERTPGNRRIMRAWINGQRICNQVAPLIQPGSKVLEVGAGIGCTVKVFEANGFAAEGIDPGGEFLKFSRDKLNAQVQVANLYDLPKQQNYDTVLLIHVIEHLRSPKEALQYISGLLKPGGMFYVECPNLQAPFARRSKLFHEAHIHNFVPATLQMLAGSCGFELKQHFGDERDPNLQMLFQYTGNATLDIDEANFERTITQLKRSNPVPYLLRTRYITDRITKLAGYATEHLTAKGFVERLIRNCKQDSQAKNTTKVKRSA